jgi:hypothetical protein
MSAVIPQAHPDSQQPSHLDRSHGTGERKIKTGSYVLAVLFLTAGGWAFNALPKFAGIFHSMLKDKPLPWLTQQVLALTPWGWLLISIGLAFLVIAKDRWKWRPPNALFAVVLIVGFLTGVVGLFLPIVTIRTGGLS